MTHASTLRLLGATALSLSLAGTLLAVTPAAPASAGLPDPPHRSTEAPALDWTDCERGEPEARGSECATLELPVDWSDPGGATFELALARRTATGPAARTGVLVFGPGGPGDSGVERVRTGVDRFSPRLRRRFDIVSFDPRGVGASSPITCTPDLLAHQPSPVIRNRKAFTHTWAFNARLREDCRKHTGPVYDHLDTMSTTHDLDAVRRALGEPQLNFHGSSYGTLLGEMYAETYPERVRTMVLESVMDHSLDTGRFMRSQATSAQDSFDEFVSWCDRTTTCALHGRDVRRTWAGLMRRAEAGTLAHPEDPKHALDPFFLTFLAFRQLYEPSWTALARMLTELESSAPPASSEPPPSPLPRTVAVFCQDWDLPLDGFADYRRRIHRMERIAPQMQNAGGLLPATSCLGSPPARNPQHRLRVHGLDRPIVVTNAVHDPATGHDMARAVARQLGRHGRLLTYDGWGHGTYSSSPCAREAIDDYLVALKVPARGTRCPAVEPPS